MNNKRILKALISGSIPLFLVVMLFTSVARSQDLPNPIDFEKVVIGTTETKSITFNNTDTEYNLGIILILNDGSGPFSLDASYVNITVPPGESDIVDIHFNPAEEASFSDALSIYYNLSLAGEVEVTGEGVTETVEELNEIAPLLALFDDLVEDGLIEGRGFGKRAERRLEAFKKMIERAYLAIEEEKTEMACQQLIVAYKQLSRDLTGDGTSELTDEIKATIDLLGCESPNRNERRHKPKPRDRHSSLSKHNR